MAVKKGVDAERKIRPSEKKAIKKERQLAADAAAESSKVMRVEEFELDMPGIKDVLNEYCIEYRDLLAQQSRIAARMEELKPVLLDLAKELHWDSIAGDGWHLVRCDGKNTGISKTRLAELGVSLAIIEDATYESKYEYIQVRKPL